jgi:hypothetical protein
MTIAAILVQLWSGYTFPTPHQNRKAPRSANPGRNPLKIRGELSKQPGPALTTTTTLALYFSHGLIPLSADHSTLVKRAP